MTNVIVKTNDDLLKNMIFDVLNEIIAQNITPFLPFCETTVRYGIKKRAQIELTRTRLGKMMLVFKLNFGNVIILPPLLQY